MQTIETHPLGFFLPENAKILMLGSFPPKKERWSINFYYPNFQNDMWRIMGLIFYGNKEYFIRSDKKGFNEQSIRSFCIEKEIAIGDTATSVIRLKDNASDKFLQVVTPFDPQAVLRQIPLCNVIAVTGQKAMDTFRSVISVTEPKVGEYIECEINKRKIKLYRMPSSSRAYPKPIEEKADSYKKMFETNGILQST